MPAQLGKFQKGGHATIINRGKETVYFGVKYLSSSEVCNSKNP